jgi:hypothetical protein
MITQELNRISKIRTNSLVGHFRENNEYGIRRIVNDENGTPLDNGPGGKKKGWKGKRHWSLAPLTNDRLRTQQSSNYTIARR